MYKKVLYQATVVGSVNSLWGINVEPEIIYKIVLHQLMATKKAFSGIANKQPLKNIKHVKDT